MREGRLVVPAGREIVPTAGQQGTGDLPDRPELHMIDQDQSDNVTSIYLLNRTGQTAQFNAANTARTWPAPRRWSTAVTTR